MCSRRARLQMVPERHRSAAGAPERVHITVRYRLVTAPLSPMPCRLAEWSVCALIRPAVANRFPVPLNLITIMVDVRTSCRLPDIVSKDIGESINMSPSIDRVSIEVCCDYDSLWINGACFVLTLDWDLVGYASRLTVTVSALPVSFRSAIIQFDRSVLIIVSSY